jgi:hypothetical protein
LLKFSRKDSSCLTDCTCVANIINRAYEVNPPRIFSIEHIIGCFGFIYSDFDLDIQKSIKENNSDINYFSTNYDAIFKDTFLKKKEKTHDYLKSLGFYNYKKFALCDIGWGGTIQKDITRHIGQLSEKYQECWGVYYATDSRIHAVTNISYSSAYDLLWGWSLLEFLVKAYTNNQEDLYKKTTEHKLLQTTYQLNALSRSIILNYVPEYVDIMEKNTFIPDNVKDFLHKRICNIINYPPKDFCIQLKDVYFSLDRRVNDKYIHLIDKLYNIKGVEIMKFETAQWVQGSQVLSGNLSNIKIFITCIPHKIQKIMFYFKYNGLQYVLKLLAKKLFMKFKSQI